MNKTWGFFILFISCNYNLPVTKAKINELITSSDKNKVIEGFYLIGETKDTTFVPAIFTNPKDPRIANNLKYSGISVYEAKMIAIKKITGSESPVAISYKPDTSIINFYFKLVKEKKLLQ